MSLILIVSIFIRLGAMGWSVVLMRRVQDLRMGFLTAMLALMATRQVLTLFASLPGNGVWGLRWDRHLNELPGLVVSVLAALSVFYLERFIVQERHDAQALLQRDRQLQQAQKMEAIGQLAGGVAHDFNNLLTVIQANADLAARRRQISEHPQKELQEIAAAVARGGALTKQLLALTRTRARELRTVDLDEVLLVMKPLLRRLVPERVEIVFLLAQSLPKVSLDTTHIGQVIINLVVNAQAAIEDSGTITLRTRAVDDTVELSVTDTGAGMTEETMRHVFEPLFTTKGEGTGLGLSICRGIVEEHGGRIEVESRIGHGSTFRLWLPVATVETALPSDAPSVGTGGNESILVVEDEPQVRKVTCDVLRSFGYRVLESVNGADALRQLENEPGVKLVLADVMMPQMGGIELRTRLARERPTLRVLLMSGYSDAPIEDESAVIAKPFTEEELTTAVRNALDRMQER